MFLFTGGYAYNSGGGGGGMGAIRSGSLRSRSFI